MNERARRLTPLSARDASMDAELKKVSAESADTIDSGMNHFNVRPTKTSYTNGRYDKVYPTAGGSKTDYFEFVVNKANQVYTDLAQSYLALTVTVKTAAGANLPAGDDNCLVWPGDNFAHSLIKKLTVSVNNTDVEFINDYATWAYVWARLNYPPETLETTGRVNGWYADGQAGRNATEFTDDTKNARKGYVKDGRKQSFYINLRSGFLNNERLLFPGNDLGIKISRTTDQFVLNAGAVNPAHGSRVEIESCYLMAYRIKANTALFNAQMNALLAGARLNYPMRRVKTQTRLLPAGTTHQNVDLSNQKHRPNRVIMGMVQGDAYSGGYTLNPFKFQNYDLNNVELVVDGLADSISFAPNFATGEELARPYACLARLVDRHESGQPFGITFDEWRERTCLFGFDLTDDQNRSDNFQLLKSGNMSMNFTFGTALPNNVTVIIIMEWDDNVDMGLDNVINTVESVI